MDRGAEEYVKANSSCVGIIDMAASFLPKFYLCFMLCEFNDKKTFGWSGLTPPPPAGPPTLLLPNFLPSALSLHRPPLVHLPLHRHNNSVNVPPRSPHDLEEAVRVLRRELDLALHELVGVADGLVGVEASAELD